jgi:hypothetical protein
MPPQQSSVVGAMARSQLDLVIGSGLVGVSIFEPGISL